MSRSSGYDIKRILFIYLLLNEYEKNFFFFEGGLIGRKITLNWIFFDDFLLGDFLNLILWMRVKFFEL
jgi:hypothetical protein